MVFRAGILLSTLLLSMTLLSACGQDIAGTALPQVADNGPSSYRRVLSAQEQARLAVSDRIRELDACGFVNQAAIATLGVPVYFGQGQDFDSCVLRFKPSIGPNRIYEVAINTGQHDTQTPPTMIDGVPVRLRPADGCMATVPYQVQDFVFWVKGRENSNTCAEATAFVRAALPMLKNKPLRAHSQRVLNTPLSRLDPCAALSVIGKDRPRLRVDTNMRPYFCSFILDSNDETTSHNITYTQKTLDILQWAREDGKIFELGAGQLQINSGTKDSPAGRCSADLYLNLGSPHTRNITADVSSRGPEQWVDVVDMSTLAGCAALQRTAAAILEFYGK
ncbi:hypothetical protein [Nocardia abscessus]|uniref:hypothetical protein n=1 Tax=Nocardia abscessus TaxID=120957 RepID=UPI0024569D61|nr:hypothetical protein [Nocardia abscessus]